MALKNKDGSPYGVFSFPNPIVADQDRWDEKKLIFHNQCGHNIVFISEDKPADPIVSREPTFLEALKDAEIATPKSQEPVKARPKNIVIIHCLPAIFIEKKDELYGESFVRKSWGNKITFEGVIISIEDLSMIFWTTYKITNGSVVYPARYVDNNENLGERRWWKASDIEEKEGGYIVRCVPSIDQPDFSS